MFPLSDTGIKNAPRKTKKYLKYENIYI